MSSRPELSLQCYFWLGLCGSPRITDVGGVPYLVPVVQKHKVTFFFPDTTYCTQICMVTC